MRPERRRHSLGVPIAVTEGRRLESRVHVDFLSHAPFVWRLVPPLGGWFGANLHNDSQGCKF